MMTIRTGFFAKTMMAALALFMLVPAVTANAQWRRDDNWQRQEQRRREREERRRQRQAERRDVDGDGNNGYGSYTQSQQTALNAGYNEGIKEGRRDRSRGGYRNINDFGAYRSADKDYNSRYGDRYTYQQYFRRGFENGYNDGLNGY